MLSPLLVLGLAACAVSVQAQDLYGADHNTTSIVGTWSSGTQQVVPGTGFANPAQETFNYPKATGVGYSFSDDGWYEIARFRYIANGSHPDCVVGTVVWAHGTYSLIDNGSIILSPIGDGFQQVQSPCTTNSNFIQNYNATELYVSWRIFTDVTFGPKLHLFDYEGNPVAPLFRLSDQPNMLPKQKLRNTEVQIVTTTSDGLVTTETIAARAKEEGRHAQPRRRRFWLW
ncbi:chaperone for protein-folding within the ER, fungal-domain-containing protein [Mycena vitilis]|nr:chaperone for protein-folding within the ER, fungal-domain-containing protein [Mycena vitilis]